MKAITTPYRRNHLQLCCLFVVSLGFMASGCSGSAGAGPPIAANGGSLPAGNVQAVTPQTSDLSASTARTQTAAYGSQASGAGRSNGVYMYGAQSANPSSTYQTSNYWVDVVFQLPSGGTSSTLFNANSTPSTITENDAQAVELGVQFKSAAAGTITAIRFYKGPKNTGPHFGNLWSATGKLLATAAFSGETTSGWQQGNFASPIAITANTPYIASYHTSVGYYSADSPYFKNCRTSGLLTALGPSPCIALSRSSSPSPSATPIAKPSSTATAQSGGDLASNLCIGGSKYTLDDHDWFDKDSTLSVSDNWPAPAGVEWSNSFSYGRANNVGTDLSWYPSQAELVADGNLSPVATIIPGVGVALKSYEQPPAIRNQAGNQDQYFSGLLSSAKAYTTGYWVYSAQLPGGNGWWPAMWLLSENGGNYFELDNEEQWGPGILGANVVSQTEQGSPAIHQETTVATSDSAQHTYGVLAASNYVGFYLDGIPKTKQYPRYQMSALNPIMNMQVCSNNSYCAPAPAPGATAQMLVKYYAHYSPPAAPAPCSPNDIAEPAP